MFPRTEVKRHGDAATPKVLQSDWMTPHGQRIPGRGATAAKGDGGGTAMATSSALRALGLSASTPGELLSECRRRHSARRDKAAAQQTKRSRLLREREELVERERQLAAADDPDEIATVDERVLQMVPEFVALLEARSRARQLNEDAARGADQAAALEARRRALAREVATLRESGTLARSRAANSQEAIHELWQALDLPVEESNGGPERAMSLLKAQEEALTAESEQLRAHLGRNVVEELKTLQREVVVEEERSRREAVLQARGSDILELASAFAAEPADMLQRAEVTSDLEHAAALRKEQEQARSERVEWQARLAAAQAELVRLHRLYAVLPTLPPDHDCPSVDEVAALDSRANELREAVQNLSEELEKRPTREASGMAGLERQVLSLSSAVAAARVQLSDLSSGDVAETIRSYELEGEELERQLSEIARDVDGLHAEIDAMAAPLQDVQTQRVEHEKRQRALRTEIERLDAEVAAGPAAHVVQQHDAALEQLRDETARLQAEGVELRRRIASAPPPARHATVTIDPSSAAPAGGTHAGDSTPSRGSRWLPSWFSWG